MSELDETRALLRDVVCLFNQEIKEHHESMESFRNYFGELLNHHIEEMEDIHNLLAASEERISRTNEMVQKMSETVSIIASTNSDLKASYIDRFQEVSKINTTLLEERSRILKENEAYHNAIKQEREKNDKVMDLLVQSLCNKSNGSLVNIHQT